MIAGAKWGAIVGALVYIVLLGVNSVGNLLFAGMSGSVMEHPTLLIPVCLSFFLLLFAFSTAGFYAGRETGKASLGAIAGMVTLIVQYLLSLIYNPAGGGTSAAAPASGHSTLSLGAQLLAAAVAPLLFLGVAASMGWLGGRPGAQQYARRHQAAKTEPAPVNTQPPA